MDGFHVFSVAKSITPNIAFFVPRNTQLAQLQTLGRVKVERNVINEKVKTLTAYYGELADK